MSAPRAWLALVQERPSDATASARAYDSGTDELSGWLSVWLRASKPVRHALRADPAAFASDGPRASASYLLVDAQRDLVFDDPVVQRARQLVLAAGGPWTSLTTLVSDASHFRGSLVAVPGDGDFDDPFELIGRGRRLHLEPGLLSAGPLRLPSPVIERYAGQPWPQSGF